MLFNGSRNNFFASDAVATSGSEVRLFSVATSPSEFSMPVFSSASLSALTGIFTSLSLSRSMV